MVRVLEQFPSSKFESIVEEVEVRFHGAPKEKWDERTFYLTISLHYNNDSQVCDVIFLVDRQEFTAAFSLNKQYPKVRGFFLKHFQHNLLYADEMYFAKQITKTIEFKTYFKEFSEKFPKYVQNFESTF